MSRTVSMTCPHCSAALTVDLEAEVIVAHHTPTVEAKKIDFNAKLKQIEEEKDRASDRMAEAMRREKSKEHIMEDRFKRLMEDAKSKVDDKPPIRDIDLT